jgi:hypothetical protein
VLAAVGQMPPAAMTISELPTVLRCLAHFGFSVALGNQPCSHERRDVEHPPLEQPIEPYTVEFGFPWLFRDLDLHPPTHVLRVYTHSGIRDQSSKRNAGKDLWTVLLGGSGRSLRFTPKGDGVDVETVGRAVELTGDCRSPAC